jgi:thioesterase domain-containing protein
MAPGGDRAFFVPRWRRIGRSVRFRTRPRPGGVPKSFVRPVQAPANLMSSHSPSGATAAGLATYLHEKIPLTRAMGMRVMDVGARLVLEAPLEPNINHLGTAFGGSLHALPTLACYAALWTLLIEAGIDCHVVIKRSTADYLQPVKGSLRAVCLRPASGLQQKFLDDLRRHKKARMEMTAIVEGENGRPAVQFTGVFVALL